MENKYKKSKSEFKPIYNSETKVLILGSHPSVKSKEAGFYYMNPRNRFWQVLSMLFDVDFKSMSKDEKIEKLKNLNIGLYDVVMSCDIIGSSDLSIKKVEPIDLKYILDNSNVRYIYLNGKKAYSLFLKYFSKLAEEYNIVYKLMPSTSPANAKYSLNNLYETWSDMLNYIN